MSDSLQPRVSVVILNWNGLEDTKECLKSVAATNYHNLEVIVVDNGSRADSKSWLAAQDGIIYVDNPTNRGFTGGHIDGLARATGEIILLLNNDAVVKPNIIERAVDHFAQDPQLFAVGGRAYQWTDDLPAYNETNPFYSFQEINVITGEARTHSTDLGIVQEVNNVSGSAVFVRKSAVDQIGYLYEPFFAYFEETDLFARAKRAGWRVLYDPALMIWHRIGAASASQPTFFYYQMFRNRWIFALRNFDRSFVRKFVKRHTITAIKSGIKGVVRREPTEWAQFRGYAAALLSTPRTLKTRRELAQSLKHSYNQKIFFEAPLPVSVAIDCRSSTADLDHSLAAIANQRYVGTDTILLVSSATQAAVEALIAEMPSCRTVVDAGTSKVRFENFVTAVAKHDWLIFMQPGDTIGPDYLATGLFTALQRGGLVVYVGQPLTSPLAQLSTHNTIGRLYLIFKPFLVESSGYRNDLSLAEAHHYLLTNFAASRAGIINFDQSQVPTGHALIPPTQPVSDTVLQDYVQAANRARRQHSLIARLWGLARRVAMRSRKLAWIDTVIMWLFNGNISLRTKLGRLKRLFAAVVSGRRKQLSGELKHIRNGLHQAHTSHLDDSLFDARTTPIFIICRDRVAPLRQLVAWLEKSDYQQIYLVDNGSSYPELMAYFNETPHQVLQLDRNAGHTSPWDSGVIKLFAAHQYYVVTDPDVIPADTCPADTLEYLHDLLLKYRLFIKAGLGLKIDDLPLEYALRDEVVAWEAQFWLDQIEPEVYVAGVDTTFALYQPDAVYAIHPSLRTGGRYVARHLPWYVNSKMLTAEDKFYREHANASINSWDSDVLRDRYSKELEQANS